VDAFAKIPNCGLHIWHGVGHAAPIEAGDEFAALLERFRT
jgi:pimeloyl-ACP methyl ester carboxylesterase